MPGQSWDANHRLVGQALLTGGRQVAHRRYHYQADDSLVAIHDSAGPSRNYRVDPLGRVTGVDGPGWRERYAYDAAGDVTASDTAHAGTLVRTSGDARYEHDAQGRVVPRQRKRLSANPIPGTTGGTPTTASSRSPHRTAPTGPTGTTRWGTAWSDALGLTESRDIEFLDPGDINFSQRSVTRNDYAMRNGQWDRNRSPVHVMEIDGQLVSYDDRRLDAAREAGVPVGVQRVDPTAPHPESTTGKTWAEKFQERFRDPLTRLNGEPVPDTGPNERPTALPPGCGGGRRRRRR